jgi:large subunit ribosomal protein L5
MAGVKETYQSECVPQLMKEFGYQNIMRVPKITKIVLNMGLGEAVQNRRSLTVRFRN